MLDVKLIRNSPQVVQEKLQKRGAKVSLEEFLSMDQTRREMIAHVEELKKKRNDVSEEIAWRKKNGEDVQIMIREMRKMAQAIKEIDAQIKHTEAKLQEILLNIPNVPHITVPSGTGSEDNVEVRRWGDQPVFDFQPLPHWELGETLDILDFERAGKVTGTRFSFSKGAGARLERALFNFMLDLHTEKHGYQEIFPPYLVNEESMKGTGQLPKFIKDMFKIQGEDYYLIPTAEVPVTNLYREEILEKEVLPICHVAYSACFRAEAGAAGRDTRGLIRQHQFNKVELVKFTEPETSYEELEKLTRDAEEVLQLLGLPYRVVLLCSGDLSFSAAKCYDLEVWMPGSGVFREISSCSNFEDFQARRAAIRYRPGYKQKARYVHTLNGSGVAVGRTVAALLENYQQKDESIAIPKVLQPYMGGLKMIEKTSEH